MTTEPTQPQVEMGPAPANGQGQSQGHRRRRRRRKNKSTQQGAPQAPQGQTQQQPAQAAPPQPQGQQQPRQSASGQGRKKKKFFKGSGGGHSQAEPGNRIGPPQGRRKDKQKGPRTFVGPMDHSYRVANGNVADTPPSTIPVHGNGNGNYYPDAYQSAPAPIREDAPTRIFCYIEDLFFQAKIQ